MTHGRREFRKFFSPHIINNYYIVYNFVRDKKKLTTRQNNKRLYLSAVYTTDHKIIKYHKIIFNENGREKNIFRIIARVSQFTGRRLVLLRSIFLVKFVIPFVYHNIYFRVSVNDG